MGLANLIQAPFKKFAAAFGERIGDEMDDIKSAGGLFSLDMDLTQESGNERFFKNYNEALRYQEKLNISMAESAASLPGVTSQYVSTSRQLTDTIQMVMEKDREGFNKMAEGFGANISMGGVDASKNAMQTVLQKQTEQVMLQSQGQTGGLPMHIMLQQLMAKEAKGGKIGIQAMTNKFRAAFQKNPLLKNFLLRAEDELAKTESGSAERLKLIMETFDKAMPKEVINKMRGSISGMQEAIRSGFLDPQAGLFGMSRANFNQAGEALMKTNVDDLGNQLYKMAEGVGDITITDDIKKKLEDMGKEAKLGEVMKGAEFTVEQLGKLGFELNTAGNVIKKGTKQEVGALSKSSTYIFEQIREILAGYGPVLLEFIGFLPMLFDPFGQMTESLMGFRDRAQLFIKGFNDKLGLMEDRILFFNSSDDSSQKSLGAQLAKQQRGRAALSTVAEYLDGIGGINKQLLADIQKRTGDTSKAGIEDFNVTEFVGPLLKSLLDSDLMAEFGKIGGIIVGGITKATVDIIKGLTGMAKGEGVNKFLDGFVDGFKEAMGGMNMGEVMAIITDALNTMLINITKFLIFTGIPLVITTIVQGLVGLLTSGDLVGTILGALGLAKVAGLMIGLFVGVGPAISGFLALVAGWAPVIVSAFTGLIPAIGGVVSSFLAFAAPALLAIGAILGVVAIFRHGEFILSSIWEGIKIIGNLLGIAGIELVKALALIPRAIIGMLDMLPGWAKNMIPGLNGIIGAVKGLEEGANKAQAEMFENVKKSGKKIADNTVKSWDKTTKDFGKIGDKFNEMFGGKTAAEVQATQALNGLSDAATKAGSTFENNKKFEGEDGKSYGWAMKDGKQILVEWGSVATATKKLVDAATDAIPEAPKVENAPTGDPKLDALRNGTFFANRQATSDALSGTVDNSLSENDPYGLNALRMGNASGGSAKERGQSTAGGLEAQKALERAKAAVPPAAGMGNVPPTPTPPSPTTTTATTTTTSTAPAAPAAPSIPSPEQTGVAAVSANVEALIEPTAASRVAIEAIKTPLVELPMKMDEAMMRQTMELSTILGVYFGQVCEKIMLEGMTIVTALTALGHTVTTSAAQVVAAMSNDTGTVKIDQNQLPLHVRGDFGGVKVASTYKGFFPMHAGNVYSAAGGMNLGSAIATEMKHKPAGSDLVIANSSETIIPASMSAGMGGSGSGGSVSVGDVTVNVTGVDDPKAIANEVAEEILQAIQRSSYTELFTS